MDELIVDTKFVKDKIGRPGWVLMDVRVAEDYTKGHIPGAVNLPAWLSKLFADDTKRQATVVARIEQTFGEMGIGNDSRVIVYGSAASVYWTAVLFWILEAGGCNSGRRKGTVQYYDGGAERWQAEGGALDQSSPAVKPAVFKAAAGMKRGAKIDEVLGIVGGRSKSVLIDTRTPEEYGGTDVRALRGGSVPGAVNIDFMKNFDPATYRMHPLDRLRELYRDVPKKRRVITFCQTGGRASYTYLVLRALGYQDVAVYHDGWRVYGSDLKLPVENETWFDFTKIGMMMQAVAKMQQKPK